MKFFQFLIISLLIITTAYGSEVKNPQLKWKGIPGAESYMIIVKNIRGKTVLRGRTRNYFYILNLKPGAYRAKIIGINKFRRRQGASPWISIRIRKMPVPEIESMNVAVIFPDQANRKYIIKGKKFRRGISVSLFQGNKKFPVTLFSAKRDHIIVSFSLPNDAEGFFDMKVVNPGGLFTVKKNLFRVKQRPQPGINSVSKLFIISEDPHTVIIKGEHLTKGSSIIFKMGNRSENLKGVFSADGTSARVYIPPRTLNPGKYTIVVESPWHKKGGFTKEFVVVSRQMPSVTSIVHSSFFHGIYRGTVTVKGDRFNKKARVHLNRGDEKISVNYKVKNKNTIVLSGSLSELKKGKYSLVVENPYGTSCTKKDALKVKDPSSGLAGMNSIYLGIGYSATFILNSWIHTFNHSPAGAFLYLGMDFSIFRFKGMASFLNYIGLEYSPLFVWYPGQVRAGFFTPQLYCVLNEIGIYGRVPLVKDLFLMIRAGGGINTSILKIQTHPQDYITADFTIYGGLGVRYIINYFGFIDFNVLYSHIFNKNNNMSALRISIMGGIRL